MSCPRPRPLFPEALALLKAGQKPRRSVGAELPRGAQMGKLGPSPARPFSNLFVWQPNSQRQLACLSPPGPRPSPKTGWGKRGAPEPPGLPPLWGVGRRMKAGLPPVRDNCCHLPGGTSPGRAFAHSLFTHRCPPPPPPPPPFVVGPGGCGREGGQPEGGVQFFCV